MFLRDFRLSVLVFCGAIPALGATRFRTSLDDPPDVATLDADAVAPRFIRSSLDLTGERREGEPAPRRIRSSLDDSSSPEVGPEASRLLRGSLDDSSRARFPLEDALAARGSRIIRLTLEEGSSAYGPLTDGTLRPRRLRTTLD